MFERAASFGWVAVMIAVALSLGLVSVLSHIIGTANNIRSAQDPVWWQEAFAYFLAVPAWIPFGAFFIFAVIFAIQLVIDGHQGREALSTIKASIERA